MKRSQLILSILAAVLVTTLFYFLLYSPQREKLAEVETEIAAEQTTQAQLQGEIDRLRTVRAEAPEVEAELAAAEAIIPRDAALPSALRQLQLAADESGTVLQSVSTSRPVPVEGDTTGLSAITVSVQLSGGYFQVVDFLRRVEDPAITPRGLTWGDLTLSPDTYPTLSVSLGGQVYAMIGTPLPPEVEPTAEGDPGTEAEGDVDADVDADADVQTEDVT